MGGLALNYTANGVQALATPVYQMTLGIDPVLLGLALAIPRIWDAFTDPVMGNISDNFRSRFGRRRPFVAMGSLLMALAFGMIWMVPLDWTQGGQLAWFVVTSVAFFTFATVFGVPLMSLYYEATPDYDERTRVMGFSTFWNRCGELVYQWIFPLSQLAIFSSAFAGVRTMGWVAAVLFLAIPGLVPAIIARERFAKLAQQQSKVKFRETVRSAFSNPAFMMLVLIVVTTVLTGYLASVMDHYLLVYYVCGGDMAAGTFWKGILSTAYALVGFASIPVLGWLSRRLGKERTLMAVLGLVVFGAIARWWLFRPGAGWLIVIDPFLGGGSLWVAIGMVVQSMFADICDEDELAHGQRREGLFGAAFSWLLKLGASLSFLVVGVVLNFVGFDAELGADQAPDTLFGMRIFLSVVPSLSAVLCIWLLRKYPISRERSAETRAKLEARRGVV
jgi:glycoside/pentoside/hexuronide:cation symporter, GPH family